MKNFFGLKYFRILTPLLWNNVGVRQTIAKNTFWLGLSEITINILKFLLLIYATHVLGDTGFGEFAFVSSFVAIFGIFFDLGLGEAITREFSKEAKNEMYISTLFSLKLLLSLVVALVVIIASFFIDSISGHLQMPVLIMSGYIFITSLSSFFYAIFRARQKMQFEFLPNFLQNLLTLLIGFILLSIFPIVTSLAWAYFFGAIFIAIPLLVYFHTRVAALHFYIDKKIWKEFLHISYPLALLGAVSLAIYNNVDSVMLGFSGRITENGWYSAAYRILTFSLLPMSFVAQSFFPALSDAYGQSQEKLERLWNTQLKICLFIAVPILFGTWVLADQLITFLYPAEFHPAALVLKILAVSGFLMYVYYPFKQLLVVINEQRKVFILFFIALLINIGLNFITIPRFSLYGAAISTLVAQLIIFIGLIILCSQKTNIKLFTSKIAQDFCYALGASVAMLSVLQWLNSYLGVIWLFFVGVFVYCISYLLLHTMGIYLFTKNGSQE